MNEQFLFYAQIVFWAMILLLVHGYLLFPMTVPFDLRGEAPGVKEGGVVKQHIHTVEIECEPSNAPEKIDLNINHLQFNQIIHLSEVELPEGVKILGDLNIPAVECTEAVEAPEVEEAAGGEEPEVIGRKKEDEEDSEK